MKDMKMLKNKKILGAIAAVAVVLPILAFAQISNSNPVQDSAPITSLTEAQGSLTNIVNFIVVVFWIWAAITYLTANGDEEKVGKAKKMVIYALIAAAIALLSTGLESIVTRLLQSGT